MRKIFVCANRSNWWATTELVESIKDALKYFGFDADHGFTNRVPPKGYDFIIQIHGRHLFKPVADITVLIEIDHKEFNEFGGTFRDYSIYTRSLHFFDYKQDLTDENIYYCPIGYSKQFDTHFARIDLRDSYHMGRNNYAKMRSTFREKHNLWTTEKHIVYGDERDELIVTSKVNINTHPRPDYWFTPLHAALILFKGKLYMQEETGKDDYSWYKPYMILFNQDDFKDKYDYWRTHDKERHEFEQFIYEDIKKNHPFEKYLYAAIGDLLESYR